MAKTFFITGTDTGVGKTLVACALLQVAKLQGLSSAAIKPLAAGATGKGDGMRNEDALALQEAMSATLPYQQVNPVVLEPPIAPHIAAAQVDKRLSADRLAGFCRGVMMHPCDLVLVEGAGGWRVPLNEREDMSIVVRALNVGVILVVGMKLGCLNHALLTAEAINNDGLEIVGWVANQVAAMDCYEENFKTLCDRLPGPCLAQLPCLGKGENLVEKATVALHSQVQFQRLL